MLQKRLDNQYAISSKILLEATAGYFQDYKILTILRKLYIFVGENFVRETILPLLRLLRENDFSSIAAREILEGVYRALSRTALSEGATRNAVEYVQSHIDILRKLPPKVAGYLVEYAGRYGEYFANRLLFFIGSVLRANRISYLEFSRFIPVLADILAKSGENAAYIALEHITDNWEDISNITSTENLYRLIQILSRVKSKDTAKIIVKTISKYSKHNRTLPGIASILLYIFSELIVCCRDEKAVGERVKKVTDLLSEEFVNELYNLSYCYDEHYFSSLWKIVEDKELYNLLISIGGSAAAVLCAIFFDLERSNIFSHEEVVDFLRAISKLPYAELCNVRESVQRLAKNAGSSTSIDDKKLRSLVKFLKLVAREEYWSDPSIANILEKMRAVGINTEYLRKQVLGIFDHSSLNRITFEDAVRSLVYYLTGSRDREKFERSRKILELLESREVVRAAAGFYRSLPREIKRKFKLYPRELDRLLKERRYSDIISSLKSAAQEYKDRYGERRDINKYLALIRAVENFRNYERKYVVLFVDKIPTMLFRYSNTLCCADLPGGNSSSASILYALDPRVVQILIAKVDRDDYYDMIEYVRKTKGEVDGRVICYICTMYTVRGNIPILVVDSVEGGDRIRDWILNNVRLLHDIIVDYARKLGVRYVLFNTRVMLEGNDRKNTPSQFIKRLGKIFGYRKVRITTSIIGPREIPYDYIYGNGKHLLETWSLRFSVPEGVAEGYLVRVQ